MVKNYVFTVAGSKGGVGKTTTSINLGACLAKAGYATAVVEVDLPMANLVDFVDLDLDVSEATTLHDVLAGEASVGEAVYDVDDRLAVVPSGTDLDGYAAADIDRLEPALERLRWHFDVMILDTPAGLSDAVIKPIEVADETVLISTPRVSSVRNVRNTKEVAQRADTEVRGLVLSKSGTGASPGAERIAKFLDMDLLGHIPEDDAVPHSQDRGEPVVDNAPNSGAAVAYRKIAAELVDTDALSSTEPAAGTDPQAGAETETDSEPDTEPAPAPATADGPDGERIATSDGGRTQATPDTEPDTDPPAEPETPDAGTASPGRPSDPGDTTETEKPSVSGEPTPAIEPVETAGTETEPAQTSTPGQAVTDTEDDDSSAAQTPVGDPDPVETDDRPADEPTDAAPAGATPETGSETDSEPGTDDTATPEGDADPDTDDEDAADPDPSLGARIRSAIGL